MRFPSRISISSLLRDACALLPLVVCAPLAAQSEPSGALPAAVEAQVGVTRVTGVSAGYAGVAATLGLGGGLRIGGGAWSVLRRIDEGPVLEGMGLDLGIGYGGALLEYRPAAAPVSARLLMGGGAATLRTIPVGTPFDTETFVVIEPSIVAETVVSGPLSLGVTAGYRITRGVDPRFLPAASGLGGFGGSVVVRLGR
ncbi:hypothetical protein [Gaopeijia maritima]|uniref:Outer membrane protein beta-barrel domain-containing protein n=1 Tax=Gaopeijia maritima TaxID=3119007 RepID=A0ABU9E7W6_9BACT